MDNVVNVDFNPRPDFDQHESQGTRNGDWIIFRCPKCPDYERRLNWRTGETKSRNLSPEINHNGRYFPHEFKEAFTNLN